MPTPGSRRAKLRSLVGRGADPVGSGAPHPSRSSMGDVLPSSGRTGARAGTTVSFRGQGGVLPEEHQQLRVGRDGWAGLRPMDCGSRVAAEPRSRRGRKYDRLFDEERRCRKKVRSRSCSGDRCAREPCGHARQRGPGAFRAAVEGRFPGPGAVAVSGVKVAHQCGLG